MQDRADSLHTDLLLCSLVLEGDLLSSFDELSEAERMERYERLARKALSFYGLEDAELRCLGQSANVMFRVQTDEGRWALRICNSGRDHQLLMRELLWLISLCRDSDVVVPEPVIMRSGDLFRSISMPGMPGFRACLLFRWVKGRFEDAPTTDHLRAMGVLAAKLHRQGQAFHFPEELQPERVSEASIEEKVPLSLLKTHYSAAQATSIRDTIPLIQKTMATLGSGSDVCGIIHGDLHHGNIPFHEGVARAIDFECVQYNYFAYDIATTFSVLQARPDLDQLQAAYVEGYTSIRPLPCNLEEHLPSLEMLRSFAMIDRILQTPRLLSDEWALGVLASTVRKAERLLAAQ